MKKNKAAAKGVCLAVCNHWSYIGIGWQLGIESCVLSVLDGMEMADREPGVKTCINQDARAYEYLAEKFPEVAARLKQYLAAGKVELIGGSYGQPLGTMYSGESNIRQVVVGRETIARALGYEMRTFLEEEEFSHPQMPQIVAGAGFKYASMAQLDTWGRAGMPVLRVPALLWEGLDGTKIPSTARTSAFCLRPEPGALPLNGSDFDAMAKLGKPLIFAWEEFGWESPEQPAYLKRPATYRQIAEARPTEFVTLEQYMDRYGQRLKTTRRFRMDEWDKLLSWGLGGDQLRIFDRKVEALLLAAERFDAIAVGLGAATHERALDQSWRDLLASQSHDVSLCEYSRWQGDRTAVFERIEDRHQFTWGAIGYNHLDAARTRGQAVLDDVLGDIARRAGSKAEADEKIVTVFNASQWPHSNLATTGKLYPLPAGSKGVQVTDGRGRKVAAQIVGSSSHRRGEWVAANVAFIAKEVTGVGYDTYRLRFVRKLVKSPGTDLRINEKKLTLENEHLHVRLDAKTGAVCSLVCKATGHEAIDAAAGGWPTFRGLGDPKAITEASWKNWFPKEDRNQPAKFDSSQGKAVMTWLAKGPVTATLRAVQDWTLLKFETRVTLAAGARHVEVVTRILCSVPPLLGVPDPGYPCFKGEIPNGYWLDFRPGFEVRQVVRDYPLGVEETKNATFHGLTFVDLVGRDRGLLVLHPGTQYFKRQEDGTVRNLLVREWESVFSREYGWPRYCEYRHALMPHRKTFRHADCLRAATHLTGGLLTAVNDTGSGELPGRHDFVSVHPSSVQLLALRKKMDGGCELRVVECEGKAATVRIKLNMPVTSACETDLLGRKVADVRWTGGELRFNIKPWKVKTFDLR